MGEAFAGFFVCDCALAGVDFVWAEARWVKTEKNIAALATPKIANRFDKPGTLRKTNLHGRDE